MKNKYYITILNGEKGDYNTEVIADTFVVEGGVYKFRNDGGWQWIPVAYYPVNKIIIYKIEETKEIA